VWWRNGDGRVPARAKENIFKKKIQIAQVRPPFCLRFLLDQNASEVDLMKVIVIVNVTQISIIFSFETASSHNCRSGELR
jgi:hypothetical protein